MLKKLALYNFQSHKATELEFSPGVNVIVGDPQSGKSAIRRAFRWLTDNRPSGFRFHSTFSGEKSPTMVQAAFDNCEVERIKGRGINSYMLTLKGLEEERFDNVGEEVPEPVSKLLNLTELNMQDQLEPFFLITSSPQEIARAINRVTRVEKVDEEWLPKLTRRINDLRSKGRTYQEELDSDRGRLEVLADLPKFERDLSAIEGLDSRVQDNLRLDGRLDRLLGDVYRVKAEMRDVDRVLELERDLAAVEDLTDELEVLGREDSVLLNAMTCSRLLGGIEKFVALEPMLEEMEELSDRIAVLDREENDLLYILQARDISREAKSQFEESVAVLVAALRKEGRCPLCLSEINAKAVKMVTEALKL